MLDRKTLATLDLIRIDARSLSPEDWQELKREVARRGQAERVAVARHMLIWLRDRLFQLLGWLHRQRSERGATSNPAAPCRV
jgi:hypothetical protein